MAPESNKKFHPVDPKILGVTVRNLVVMAMFLWDLCTLAFCYPRRLILNVADTED
jgi:hypothetical protein